MKKLIILISGVLIFAYAYPQETGIQKGLIAHYPMDIKGTDISGNNRDGKVYSARPATDRKGKPKSALQFYPGKGIYKRGLWAPVNINPDKLPKLTITAWVKADKTYGQANVIACGEKKNCRGLVIDKKDGEWYWSANCGKDGILNGELVTTDWDFIAMLYDQECQAVRFIFNDQVFAGPGRLSGCSDVLTIGNFEGLIDDVTIYDRLLSLSELEKIYGSSIVKDTGKLVIIDKYAYKKRLKERDLEELQTNKIRIIADDKYHIYETRRSSNVKEYLKEGDTIRILSLDSGWVQVSYHHEKVGYTSQGSVLGYTYPAGGSGFLHSVKFTIQHIFNFTSVKSWIIVGVCTILLILSFRFFYKIDYFFRRLSRQDEVAMGAGKMDSEAYKPSFLKRFFSYRSRRWWPLMMGVIAAIILFVGSIWDGSEMEWFFQEGLKIIPSGFERPVDWFLYGGCMLILVMTVIMILESFVTAGWLGGTLRILFILLVNLLSLLVTFYLFVLVMLVLLVLFGIMLFTGAFRRDRYYYY